MKLARSLKRRSAADFDFLACGENSLDTIARGSGSWRPGTKQRVSLLVDLPGGQAASAAVGCARLGWRTRYAGAVGDDEAGRRVCEALARDRVDVVVVTRIGGRTRRAIVLVDADTGDRTVLESRDPALDLRAGELPDHLFANGRVLLVDGTDPAQAARAARAARAADVRTMIDVDRRCEGLADLLRLIDVIVLPESAAADIAGVTELGRALDVIGRESGAAAVVATLGAAGALAWCDGQEVRAPGGAGDVVDTTGAGDAFRAGFSAGWLGRSGTNPDPKDPPDLEDLLADANFVARLSCREVGAQAGLPVAAEVPAHLRGGV